MFYITEPAIFENKHDISSVKFIDNIETLTKHLETYLII